MKRSKSISAAFKADFNALQMVEIDGNGGRHDQPVAASRARLE
jgi:hypothetical protein